jgi:Na+/H+ antiporter NhaC
MEFGWLSLLPPLIAIILAIVTRRVLLSLGISILAGGGLLAWKQSPSRNWFAATFDSVWNDHLYPALIDGAHLQVFLFSLTLGAMVGVIEASGGMESLVRRLTRRVQSRRGGQMLVWLLGLAIFFDDYANTLLLGSTMRTAADRLKFSRAKLAYLVDSTAAPVAGLALVSTWVATEIDLIGEGLRGANVATDVTAFGVFLASVPYRFYAGLALVMVAVIAWSGRDFGPMLTMESAAQSPENRSPENRGGPTNDDPTNDDPTNDDANASGKRLRSSDDDRRRGGGWLLRMLRPPQASTAPIPTNIESIEDPSWLWTAAVVPVVVCVTVVCALLAQTGMAATGDSNLTGLRYLGQVIGSADSYIALVWGSVTGLASALLIGALGSSRRQPAQPLEKLFLGMLRGAWHIFPAMVILWLAWTLSSMTDGQSTDDAGNVFGPYLDTGGFLAGELRESNMPTWLLPTAVFVTAGFVAMATGTSWGTMAILTPLSVQLAVLAGADSVGESAAALDGGPLLLPVVGAVLAGAIFGDHCSPISDTTVLSSRASGCDHILHVRTQLPYAFSVGLITILCGTIPSGFGFSAWGSLAIGCVAIVVVVRIFGRRPES